MMVYLFYMIRNKIVIYFIYFLLGIFLLTYSLFPTDIDIQDHMDNSINIKYILISTILYSTIIVLVIGAGFLYDLQATIINPKIFLYQDRENKQDNNVFQSMILLFISFMLRVWILKVFLLIIIEKLNAYSVITFGHSIISTGTFPINSMDKIMYAFQLLGVSEQFTASRNIFISSYLAFISLIETLVSMFSVSIFFYILSNFPQFIRKDK